MPYVKHITYISDHSISESTTPTLLKSSIKSTWSRFKSIKFGNGQKGQTDKSIENEDIMLYIENNQLM